MKNKYLISLFLKTLIFILTISIFVSGCVFDKTGTENKNNNSKNTSSSTTSSTTSSTSTITLNKNNNFSYQPLKKDILDYLKYNDNYNLNATSKIVFYYNGAGCDAIKHFQETMNKYKHSNDWNKSYTFIGFNVPKSGCLQTNDENILRKKGMISCYSNEWKNFELLIHECNPFCIVNLEKKLFFKGSKTLDEYIYNVLYYFYYE